MKLINQINNIEMSHPPNHKNNNNTTITMLIIVIVLNLYGCQCGPILSNK